MANAQFLSSAFTFITTRKVKSHRLFTEAVANRVGLEIGGLSWPFHDWSFLPLYRYAARIDNCNFSGTTIWNTAANDQPYRFHKRKEPGRTIIAEASKLTSIPNGTYDFVLASHMLEHSANPIKVLHELRRVVKPGGAIVVVLPHYRYTFDHRRTPTPLSHLIDDFKQDTGEDDLTHLDEVLALHDLSKDPQAGTPEEFAVRCRNNWNVRAIHHHVFDETNAQAMLAAAGLKVKHTEFAKPFNIVLLALA